MKEFFVYLTNDGPTGFSAIGLMADSYVEIANGVQFVTKGEVRATFYGTRFIGFAERSALTE
jgi:hypothetical protein